MNVERLEVGAFRTSYNSYDINLNTLASFNNDPDFLLGFYTGGIGAAVFHFKDEKYDALYAAQRAATPDKRADAVTAAAQYLWENQATLYLTDEVWFFIVNKRVHDYKRAPLVGEKSRAAGVDRLLTARRSRKGPADPAGFFTDSGPDGVFRAATHSPVHHHRDHDRGGGVSGAARLGWRSGPDPRAGLRPS